MHLKDVFAKGLQCVKTIFVGITIVQFSFGGLLVGSAEAKEHSNTRTPIKHVIVLIGENRTFDHLFATYKPKSGDGIKNLLSEGIIKADGTPGPQFKKAAQFQAVKPFKTEYYISLNKSEKAPYTTLPSPTLNFSPSPNTSIVGFATEPPPFPANTPTTFLKAIEPSLEESDLHLLTTGASGQDNTFVLPDPDTRVQISITCRTGRSRLRARSFRTIRTQGIRRIVCSRCGSNRIAMSPTPRSKILPDA